MLERMWQNPPDGELKDILSAKPVLAVVGLSPNPERISHGVAKYMQKNGYTIIPVNPVADEVLGAKAYPDIAAIPGKVDLVDVFRRSEFVPEVAEQAIAKGAKVLWLQEGVRHDPSAQKAQEAGITVIQDMCIKKVHHRLLSQ